MGETLILPVKTYPEVHVALLSAEQYLHYWPEIEKQLDLVPHIWAPYFTKQYLHDIPSHQELMVWETGLNGAVTVIVFAHFCYGPRGKGIRFVLALGNSLDACLPQLEATFEKLARDTGCDFVVILGRRGWLRKLKGFKEDCVVMSRQIQNFQVQ